ncbi:MAG: SMP-30/gluconolactonase/LRE family protein [Pseudomonadota bacterium]
MNESRIGPRRGRVLLGVGVALILVTLSWLLLPGPIEPVAWSPAPAPAMTGAFTPNDRLALARIIAKGQIDGPEDVAVDADGRLYGGTQDGWIVRVDPDGSVERWVETGGRPLGLHFDAEGNLIVADSWKGLLAIDPDGAVDALATGVDGRPFLFTDDLDIAADGRIYFSDASERFTQPDYMLDLLEGRPHGRLLVHDPRTGETTMLLDDLYFANGIALSSDEDFVLVNETYRLRITRYWLKGPKAGTHEIFLDNLPGYPDGVASDDAGRFYVALFTVRNRLGDTIADKPFIKRTIAKLPRVFWPKPAPHGFVLVLDEAGNVLESLQDAGGETVYNVTSAEPEGDLLFLGSLHDDKISVVALPPPGGP